ncbi:MAG TPA: GNAT family N-acetyltransferase [Burkholderiales bacterium]|nr:GNAT family N-acetyltransferase [Burkholderiales bacterium]
MAQKPYPAELVEKFKLRDGANVTIRPIRAQDIGIERTFVRDLSTESRYFRFLHTLRELDEQTLIRLTDIDYDHDMALVAVVCENDLEVQIGVARYVVGSSGKDCEFAVAIADSWQGKGIGMRLMVNLLRAARERGLEMVEGFVLYGNQAMFALAAALGFRIEPIGGDASTRRVVLDLRYPAAVTTAGTIQPGA